MCADCGVYVKVMQISSASQLQHLTAAPPQAMNELPFYVTVDNLVAGNRTFTCSTPPAADALVRPHNTSRAT